MKRIIIGLTGASGSILAYTAIKMLLDDGHEVHLVASSLGERVMAYELSRDYSQILDELNAYQTFTHHSNDDLFASIASGSFPVDAMCIIPCSMGTLGKIANGIADNLLCRAADVTLKERRPLVLVTRETPLSGIHLENMVKVSRYGAIIMPPVPAFYNKPKTLDDVINHTASRVLLALGINTKAHVQWEGSSDA